MRVLVGTSGYSYKEWKGTFYPEDLPAAKMLPFYATQFGTVEINNTFYRMPEGKTLGKWAGEVPETFVFVLKAPQRITHGKRLAGAEDDVRYFFEAAAELGPKLGPVLFQLPPFAKKDIEKLRAFLRVLPKHPVAFEFRHASWFDDVVFALLREHDAALCAADTDEVADPALLPMSTASWGYLRLRRTQYGDGDLQRWARRVQEQRDWSSAFVFFKHEDEGKGPAFARTFLGSLAD
ncbi:MAG: DUF72 domain-containing protein [Thermoanaerobaculia bacterium]